MARLEFYTNSSAKRPIGARTVQRLRSDVDLSRLVRGTSSQLRGGRFHGHCTSASAMKQRTWTRAIKKHTQEAENKGRPATRLALLLLPDADVGRQPQKNSSCTMDFHRVWQSGFNALPSMSRRDAMAARTSHRTSSRPACSATQRGTRRSFPWTPPDMLPSSVPGWQRAGGTRRRSRPLSAEEQGHRFEPNRLHDYPDCEIKSGSVDVRKNVDLPKCIVQCIARSIEIGLICQCIGGNPWICCNWGRVPPSPP